MIKLAEFFELGGEIRDERGKRGMGRGEGDEGWKEGGKGARKREKRGRKKMRKTGGGEESDNWAKGAQ